MFPTRYTNLVDVRKKHGHRADKIAAYFLQADPLADDVVALFAQLPPGRGQQMLNRALEEGIGAVGQAPEALRKLFAQLEDVPLWLDRKLLDLGARTHLRCGVVGGIVLACCCLPLAYRSGVGNKPLVQTRKFLDLSIGRLSATHRFFIETCTPGGLKRHSLGWKLTVQVRLRHAMMRRHLRRLPTKPWKQNEWGHPINQVDLAATRLLFCVSLLQYLRQVGFHFTARESEGVMHLWRYSGYLLGIAPELLCSTETEGRRLLALLLDLAGTPDPDSVELTQSLMKRAVPVLMAAALSRLVPFGKARHKHKLPRALGHARHGLSRLLLGLAGGLDQLTDFSYGLSHGLLGSRTASELQYPWTVWRYTAPVLLRSIITPLEMCRRFIPGATDFAFGFGFNQLRGLMESELFARMPASQAPTRTDIKSRTEQPPHAR
jgi:hypothetical protein